VWSAEVSGDQELIVFRCFVEQFTSRGSRLRTILAEGAVQMGLGHLDGIVNDVAEEDAGVLASSGSHRDMTGGVAWGGEDGEKIVNLLLA
jgi:hypothetical protein